MKRKSIQIKQVVLRLPAVLLLAALTCTVMAQNTPRPLPPKLGPLAKPQSTADWMNFREGTSINPNTIFTDLKDAFQLSARDTMVLAKKDKDELGFQHYRYQQYYNNRKVVYSEYIVHQQPDGFVKSANGHLITGLNLDSRPAVSEQQALNSALQFMNAKKYLWQNSEMEKELKRQKNNPAATYYPKGELVYAPNKYDGPFQPADYRLTWQFTIYSD